MNKKEFQELAALLNIVPNALGQVVVTDKPGGLRFRAPHVTMDQLGAFINLLLDDLTHTFASMQEDENIVQKFDVSDVKRIINLHKVNDLSLAEARSSEE